MKIGITGSQIHLTMNFAGGAKGSNDFEILEITVALCI
jgi:hypothetical protein